jgi:Putative phage metallopeptidase
MRRQLFVHRARKPKQPKAVNYELIGEDEIVGRPMYHLLRELVDAHHRDELHEARIALAWCTSWKPDVDGRVTLGKCKKASDLDRELMAFDFVILLRRSFWRNETVTDAQRAALLDHELCHAGLKFDERGDPVEDARGRPVYRTKKHDVEEFINVVKRHGIWRHELEDMAAALARSHTATTFQPCDDCRESPGWMPVTDDAGVVRVQRCVCYRQWQETRPEPATV